MKSCPKCMQENDDTAKFCMLCRSPFGSAAAPTCPRGHIMDPTWSECAYCKAEGSSAAGPARSKTVVEDAIGADFSQPQSPPVKRPEAPVRESGSRRKTVFIAPPDANEDEGAPHPRQAARKIVGILVTYSWKPEGQVFPVREGRNLIGRGAECEICVPEDHTLSNVNSHITYRKSFTAGDMVSMSGTDLNGEPIEEQFAPISNYAKLRSGSTHWTFIVVQPPDSAEK